MQGLTVGQTSGTLRAGHQRLSCSSALHCSSAPCRTRSPSPCATPPLCFSRGGPTGLDVTDANGKSFRPTSRGGWAVISDVLKDKQVKFLAPQEVIFARDDGLPLVDIRPVTQFRQGYIEGAKSIQFYRPIEGWDLWKVARRANFALFMTEGTEPNPEFLDEVRALVPDTSTPITLMCNLGGHLDDYGPSPNGMQTRSLMAAYELLNAGYRNVRVLKGGINEWSRQERALVQD